ncbi:hypothetical protein [Bradyrhizobium sp. 143]|uniref:hypothetical protein n=1 Tax=Bradyrhizobium sp. 143 TaxID=2782619 RepID=UPI001FFA70F4|nr:hypothetical protein [Bradyrhizobium sp. 143]MCK1730955.1 hypothetical protein [Bradyrhizobium sp. 142]
MKPNRKSIRSKRAINCLISCQKTIKIVLVHNHNDSDAKPKIKVGKNTGGWNGNRTALARDGVQCRQSAAYHPDKSWKLLAEADYWEHLAAAALSEQLKDSAAANDLAAA